MVKKKKKTISNLETVHDQLLFISTLLSQFYKKSHGVWSFKSFGPQLLFAMKMSAVALSFCSIFRSLYHCFILHAFMNLITKHSSSQRRILLRSSIYSIYIADIVENIMNNPKLRVNKAQN